MMKGRPISEGPEVGFQAMLAPIPRPWSRKRGQNAWQHYSVARKWAAPSSSSAPWREAGRGRRGRPEASSPKQPTRKTPASGQGSSRGCTRSCPPPATAPPACSAGLQSRPRVGQGVEASRPSRTPYGVGGESGGKPGEDFLGVLEGEVKPRGVPAGGVLALGQFPCHPSCPLVCFAPLPGFRRLEPALAGLRVDPLQQQGSTGVRA